MEPRPVLYEGGAQGKSNNSINGNADSKEEIQKILEKYQRQWLTGRRPHKGNDRHKYRYSRKIFKCLESYPTEVSFQ